MTKRTATIHLINPSDTSFGTAVITPRWLFVLAAATDKAFGDPEICDETLEHLDLDRIHPGDVVGIGIHTGNALRGYEVGRATRQRGAWVVFGGIHSTLYSDEPFEQGGAHAVVKGDGDLVWNQVLRDCASGAPERIYNGGKVEPQDFKQARWDLLPADSYMWASVQTVRDAPNTARFVRYGVRTDNALGSARPTA
jgi:radical SAM superfamily enzyme YgiQ (UPF0313 family)